MKIISIPFGEQVISKSLYQDYGVFDERAGGWIKVKYKAYEGYIFSGFITKLKIPSFDINQLDCGYLTWFENLIRENVDSLICAGIKEYNGFDGDGKDWTVSEWELFNNETEIYYFSGYESRSLIIESRIISMNDILNLLDFYIDQMITKCPEIYGYKVENRPEIKISKHGEHIFEISCPTMRFYSQESLNKVIIKLSLLDL